MKRILCVLLSAALLMGVSFCLPVAAAGEEHLFYEAELNEAQTMLTVRLYTDGLNWTAIDFGIAFEPEVLELRTVVTGKKIETARSRGFDFLTMSATPEKANASGYCNFVAAVGSSDCRMTAYAGPIAVFTFSVRDTTKARASLSVCVAALVDAQGEPLLEYQSFTLAQTPIPYFTAQENLFRYGDLDRSGISIYDAMLIMQHLVGMTELNEMQTAAACVSGGEEITIYDAMLIMQYLVGMIEEFPAEQA